MLGPQLKLLQLGVVFKKYADFCIFLLNYLYPF